MLSHRRGAGRENNGSVWEGVRREIWKDELGRGPSGRWEPRGFGRCCWSGWLCADQACFRVPRDGRFGAVLRSCSVEASSAVLQAKWCPKHGPEAAAAVGGLGAGWGGWGGSVCSVGCRHGGGAACGARAVGPRSRRRREAGRAKAKLAGKQGA